MFLKIILVLFAMSAALLTAHHSFMAFAYKEADCARHLKRSFAWAGVLVVLVMAVNGLYGYLLMLAIVGWAVYQFVRLSDAMAARLSE